MLVEDKLVGVIYSSYSTREGGEALFAASMVDALADPELKKTLQRELGRLPAVVDIITPEVDFGSALVDVSRADPANIQEVAGSQLKLTNLYYENVLSQAKRSFNAAVVAGSVGLLFFLVAIGFSLGSSQLTAPLISATGGGLVEAVAGLNFWLYSSTAEQLNSFHLRLDRMQRYLVANSISQGLGEIQRDVVISGLVKAISTSEWLDGDAPVV
ncbi:hypothetical protein [Streptomyces sp. AGS-58]|uniref:TRADD-N-associated membrane domain-containing protein n=1 Tax=unclassified Streptomyces TaxID=2593676 RepID=UPI0035A2F4A9